MNGAKRVLLLGGIALVLMGMSYGLWYAVYAEHQALDGIGQSLSAGFVAAAERNPALSESSLQHYRQAKYDYDRQVDVHGHWIGLAMLLIILAVAYDRVEFSEKSKLLLAWGLLAGVVLFPLGVLLETASHGPLPKAIAVLGSALVIGALAAITLGFARGRETPEAR